MQLTKRQLRESWQGDRRKERARLLFTAAATVLLFLFCLSFRFQAYGFDDKFVPLAYLRSYRLAARLLLARLTDSALYHQREAVIEAFGSVTYYGALAQLRTMLAAFAAGAGLAVSGAVFQTAYRNPMASPNIIGATAGVQLGNVLVVMAFSSQAYENIVLRYQYCYGLTALCIGLVLALGKIAGIRRGSGTLEMVMAGSIVSQTVRVFAMYFMYNLPDEDLLLYEEISFGTYLQTDRVSMAVFFSVMTASLLPVLLMRFRLNAMGMDRDERTGMGVSGVYGLAAQVCGAVMATCAMIHFGEAGMLSMVVPYILRRAVGSDFRRLSVYSALGGGALMMLCRLLGSFWLIADTPIPVTFFIELFLTPAFLVILARQRRSSDEA